MRLVGNNAVHPATLDLTDDHDTALLLFHLLNTVVAATITLSKGMQQVQQRLAGQQSSATTTSTSNRIASSPGEVGANT